MANGLSGSPLTQVLVYALNFNCPELIDIEVIQDLRKTALDVEVIFHISSTNYKHCAWCSPIELAIDIKRIDVVKSLVKAGANPISPYSKTSELCGVVQLFDEYYEFGTNHYILWLLHEHILSKDLPRFIETVVKLNIFNQQSVNMFTRVGRHPAHAILTCGHEEMVRRFLEHWKKSNFLKIEDTIGRTALQISAERGDLESVRVLLSL